MLEKLKGDLSFVGSKESLPTVEVDLGSIPETYCGYDDIVANALRPFASSNPSTRATVYVYQGMSINFHKQTDSAFFVVVGEKGILDILLNAFNLTPGIRAKASDCISPSTATLQYHVQDGLVWRPVDALTWYAASDAEKDDA